MAISIASRFNNLIFSLLILIIHIGCFIFTSSPDHHNNTPNKRRKSLPNLSPQKALTSSWSFIKRVFTSSKQRCNPQTPTATITTTTFSSPRSSQYSYSTLPLSDPNNPNPRKRRSSDSLSENPFLPLRNDIFPCTTCGEIFHKQNVLEHHLATKHAVSELRDNDSGKNIVWIIFNTGWTTREKIPKIQRILKIHNSAKILSKFEEYREVVRSRAARSIHRDERCVADGNELLRFHCTTFVCNLGQNGNSSLCSQHYCSACGIIRAGFSSKLDGISTLSTSSRAHMSVPDDVEDEFAFMNVKRAMLVCRVIAGRVGFDPMIGPVGKDDQGYDSLVGRSGGKSDDDELLVFNPRAVLPCFVIVYSV